MFVVQKCRVSGICHVKHSIAWCTGKWLMGHSLVMFSAIHSQKLYSQWDYHPEGTSDPWEVQGREDGSRRAGFSQKQLTPIPPRSPPKHGMETVLQMCTNQQPKNEIKEWQRQGSLPLSIKHSAFEKEWTQTNEVQGRAGVGKLLLQSLQ